MLEKEQNIVELLSAIKQLNDAVNTVQLSNFVVETPEGALLKFLIKSYDDSNVGNLAQMLDETTQVKKQEETAEPTEKVERQTIKRKPLVNGKKIKGTLAKSVEKLYRTPLIVERYKKVKKTIGQQPDRETNVKKLVALTGYSVNSLVAHLRYGVELSEIVLDKKKQTYKIPGVKQAPLELKRAYVKKGTETVLTDTLAKEIAEKYQIVVSSERYNKVMHVLSTHTDGKATLEEIQKLSDNVPKSVVYPLMRYGVLKGDVVSLPKNTFMTRANYDRSNQKVVKAESKSFIKEKQHEMFDKGGKLIIDKEKEQ